MPEGINPRPETSIAPYVLRVPLPGISRDQIMVAFFDGYVEVCGRSVSEWHESASGVNYYEAEEWAARHLVPVPPDADLKNAQVTLRDGEAMVTIPRRSGDPG